ncbi:MAG: methyltransferase domain-containing protein [Planctomycetota bacterium]|jgi:SAM-dependent methyltransferase
MDPTASRPRGTDVDLDVEQAVHDRYAAGARAVQPSFCCPVAYDTEDLDHVPQEILDKDYGCGDPSRYAREGETVLDLGSGAGKACYVLSRKVGPEGRVLGVDFTSDMLALARKHQRAVAEAIGYDNVTFARGRIQDLGLSLDAVDDWLAAHPVSSLDAMAALEAECDRLRREEPLVADGAVDLVVSNCVLNLVRTEDKEALFDEIFRVLRRGGRAVISDIVCDEEPTPEMRRDPDLWSGCIAGAFTEEALVQRFEEAGFYGVEVLERSTDPWQVVEGIEFRSVTVRAFKGKEGPCLEGKQAVVYRGPWRTVTDDDGHTLLRGARMAVCDKTYRLLTDPAGPYAGHVFAVPPHVRIPMAGARPFDCTGDRRREPGETKNAAFRVKPSCAADGGGGSPSACA